MGVSPLFFVTQIYRKQPRKSRENAKKNTLNINKFSPSKLTKNTHFLVVDFDSVSDVFDLNCGAKLAVSADDYVTVFGFKLNGTASAV